MVWYTWYTMVYHGSGISLIYHGIHRGIPWCTMVYHGTPWYDHVVTHRGCTTVYHGIPWFTIVYHGTPWYTMAYHGMTAMCYDIVVKRYNMVYTTIYHRLPWCTMVYNGIPRYTRVYCGTPWYTTLWLQCVMTLSHHDIPWCTPCTMVYHCTTTMCYDTVVYHSLYTMLTTHSMFAGDLHSHTAVAGLAPSLVVNLSNRVTHR